jgi:hypothetical protein
MSRLRCLKKRRSECEYYVDDIPIEKNLPEYDKENFDAISHEPQLIQIQPILTVSEVVSSIKQSLEDLGHVITPKRWSTTQPMLNEESSTIEEKN